MLLDLMKKRLVIASEPEKQDKLNTGYIKLLTGKDRVKTRKCYGNEMIEFSINFRTILLCNDIPQVDDPSDQAYQRRLKCINFPFEFVDEPKEPHQKLIDHTLVVEDLKLEFIYLLFKYYKNYRQNGLPKNENILKFTEKVNNNNSPSLLFMQENTEPANTHIHTSKLYTEFKIWFRKNYPEDKLLSNRGFINNLRPKYHIYDSVKMPGIDHSTTGIKNLKMKIKNDDDLFNNNNNLNNNDNILDNNNNDINNDINNILDI